MLPPSPEGVRHTEALTERLLAQPELLDQLLRCRAVEVAKQAGKALEAEYGWGEISEDELLAPIFAELEPDVRGYFTEELEDGVSVYYAQHSQPSGPGRSDPTVACAEHRKKRLRDYHRSLGDSAVPLKNSAEASCPTQTPATHSAGSL